MTVLMIVLLVVVPLLFIAGGAFVVMKLQRKVIDRVSNTALEQRLQREGVAGTAQVLDAADTGERIEAIYVLTRLRLRIAGNERVDAFETDIVVPLSPVRLAQFAPGATIRVRVDPLSREVVVDQPRR